MNTFVFDFLDSDGNSDFRIVNGFDYQTAWSLFVKEVPDYMKILHVYVQLW